MNEQDHREGIKKTKKAYYDIDATLTTSTTGKWCRQGIPICKKDEKNLSSIKKKNKFVLLSLIYIYIYVLTYSVKIKTEFTAVQFYRCTQINRNKKMEPLITPTIFSENTMHRQAKTKNSKSKYHLNQKVKGYFRMHTQWTKIVFMQIHKINSVPLMTETIITEIYASLTLTSSN